jgi:hypothetical protein
MPKNRILGSRIASFNKLNRHSGTWLTFMDTYLKRKDLWKKCFICMKLGSRCVMLMCGHRMCIKCCDSWFSQSLSCPFCRHGVFPKENRIILLLPRKDQMWLQPQGEDLSRCFKPPCLVIYSTDGMPIFMRQTRKENASRLMRIQNSLLERLWNVVEEFEKRIGLNTGFRHYCWIMWQSQDRSPSKSSKYGSVNDGDTKSFLL